MAVVTGLAAVIDGGEPLPCELDIEQDVEYIRSLSATKPDPAWTHTDTAGHFHAWAAEGKLPTLLAEVREIPCDGICGDPSCEGTTETRYHCLLCGEEVTPRYVPDSAAQEFGTPVYGRKRARITVRGMAPEMGRQVSVQILDDGQGLFGIATVVGGGAGSEGARAELAALWLEERLT